MAQSGSAKPLFLTLVCIATLCRQVLGAPVESEDVGMQLTDGSAPPQRLRPSLNDNSRSNDSTDTGTVDSRGELPWPEEFNRVVPVFVKTLSGASFELEINLTEKVDGLKERIWKKTGVPTSVQSLIVNERGIDSSQDYLCNLGLDAGSIVCMYFHSKDIISSDQIAGLQELPVAHTVDHDEAAPIFREAEADAGESAAVRGGPIASLYKDARNWITRDNPHPSWNTDLFDPVAHLVPNPDDAHWIKKHSRLLERYSLPEASESDRQKRELVQAQLRLSLAVKQYRVARPLNSTCDEAKYPGISLGGSGYTYDAGAEQQQVSLGADVNNWAPDAFSDSDVVRLFELSERVRHVLARSAQTGEETLSIPSRGRINRAILISYLEALAGHTRVVEHSRASENVECNICRDKLTAEPATKLPCGHAFHADCILSWATSLYQRQTIAPTSCPVCKQKFMFPYETLARAELEKPELRGE